MASVRRNVRRSFLRALVRLRRRARALGLERRLELVTWPRALWLGVMMILAAYLLQDRRLPEPAEEDLADLDCLALNIYFEARGEVLKGKRAVGHVVMNRVADKEFPGTVCAVVRQGGEEKRHRCQFSWWCDGRSDRPLDRMAWRESREIAWKVMRGASRDPTHGALWYHAVYVTPDWSDTMDKGPRIGRHLFYHRP